LLAINGGSPHISRTFQPYQSLGAEEVRAVNQVLDSKVLSEFLGSSGSFFLGGKNVRIFENHAAKLFQSEYCVSFNSWTSGLVAAVGSIPNLEPGDEIITSPWTMSATAMAILHNNAIPVFADIELGTYCLDPAQVEKLIGPRTKAILTVDIFGQTSNYAELRRLCDKYSLLLIADSAQAPGAKYRNSPVSTWADIGGYSLNYHKHIHSGEGGFALTNSEFLADRMRLIRNHAESVLISRDKPDLSNMVGHNFRLGEIESAIANEQLYKLDRLVDGRIRAGNSLIQKLSAFPFLDLPEISSNYENVFYFLPIRYTPTKEVSRDQLFETLKSEGVPALQSQYTNIHRLPIFTNLTAFGSSGFPWSSRIDNFTHTYGQGNCPVAEKLYDSEFFGIYMCGLEFLEEEIEDIFGAFRKVWQELFGLEVA
jgi:dTDP-4-amino-4,6-dideoxygalactose transaminase